MTNYLVKSTANYLLCVILNSGERVTKYISYPNTVHFILGGECLHMCKHLLDTFHPTLKESCKTMIS